MSDSVEYYNSDHVKNQPMFLKNESTNQKTKRRVWFYDSPFRRIAHKKFEKIKFFVKLTTIIYFFGLQIHDHRTITAWPAAPSRYISATFIPKYKKVIWTDASIDHIKRDIIK